MNKSLSLTKKLSIMEGMLSCGIAVLNAGFVFTALALYFKSTPFIIAFLSAIPIITQGAQVFTLKIYRIFKTRKKAFIIIAIMSRGIYLLIPLMIVLDFKSPYILVFILILHNLFGTILGNIWTATMQFVIKSDERAEYFSKRNLYISVATMIYFYLYGYALNKFDPKTGLFIVTLLMSISSIISVVLLNKHFVPCLDFKTTDKMSFFAPLRDNDFLKFLVFAIFWILGNELTKPFFSYYQVQILNVNKQYLGSLSVVSGIISIILYLFLGKMTKKIGNERLLFVGIMISTVNFLLYIFINSSNFKYILSIEAVINGFANSIVGLTFFNMLLSIIKTPVEAYSGLFSMISGFFGLIAALMGGAIGNATQNKSFIIFDYSFSEIKIIFLFGFIIRIITLIILAYVEKNQTVLTKELSL